MHMIARSLLASRADSKRHNFGFKAGNVPHNKGTKGEMEKFVPAPYIRVSDQMFNMVSETPSTAEREKMVLWPRCYHLPRPRKQTEKNIQKSLTDVESEQ